MSDMYMNGRGTKAHTKKLVDDMWDALPLAIVGGFVGTLSAASAILAYVHQAWCFTLAAIMLAIVAWLLHEPWIEALFAVRQHTEMMKAETARRGKGWASS